MGADKCPRYLRDIVQSIPYVPMCVLTQIRRATSHVHGSIVRRLDIVGVNN